MQPVVRRVVIIASPPDHPSTRLRILQYKSALEESGFAFEVVFVPYGRPGGSGSFLRKLGDVVREADVVFVQRVLRRPINLLLKRLGAAVVFDLDDATHYIRPSQYARATRADPLKSAYRLVARGNRNFSSRKHLLDDMLRFAAVVIVGNRWLREDLLRSVGRDFVVLPTTVPVDPALRKQHSETSPVTLGWTGVKDSLFYLDTIGDSLRDLGARYGDRVRLTVVSSSPYRGIDGLETRFVPWSIDSEQEALRTFDIGLMPLLDDPFSRGKCSFKAILCMSRGLPVVISPVGANRELIEHGENGFLASARGQWTESLCRLIDDVELRRQIGEKAVETIQTSFSSDMVFQGLESVLRDVAPRTT